MWRRGQRPRSLNTVVDVAVVRNNLPLDRGPFDDGRGRRRRRRRRARRGRPGPLPFHHNANSIPLTIRSRGPGSPPLDDTTVYIDSEVSLPLRGRGRRRFNIPRTWSRHRPPRRTETSWPLDIACERLWTGAAGSSAVNSLYLPGTEHQLPGVGPPVLLAKKRGDTVVSTNIRVVLDRHWGTAKFPLVEVIIASRRAPPISIVKVTTTRASVRHGEERFKGCFFFLTILRLSKVSLPEPCFLFWWWWW